MVKSATAHFCLLTSCVSQGNTPQMSGPMLRRGW